MIESLHRADVTPEGGGLPCVRGLRVPVSLVLSQLAPGRTIDEVLGDYPHLEREDVFAVLRHAAAVVHGREIAVTRPA